MNMNNIKLVIWDMDETFWDGTLSDHNMVFVEENAELVRQMVDAGVMCSVCSKNDRDPVMEVLADHEIAELFVFPSVNWTPKGERVQQILSLMNLRAPNVLFVDDNPTNRGEVAAVCPGIMVADVDVIPALREHFLAAEKKDTAHTRLEQYKLLEKKAEYKALTGSNVAFLESCNILVRIKEDCLSHVDRIHDLIMRSNQLNFTKLRSTREELVELINDETVQTGYVEVSDKFGDYGLVGFFAEKEHRLIHFAFSCRTLNMGVEQYVYAQLGRPELEIQGEVSSSLTGTVPHWINQTGTAEAQKKSSITKRGRILLKGLCDMQQIFSFIHDDSHIIKEFVYVNDNGVSIESGCHTAQIVDSLDLEQETVERLIRTLPFGDAGMFVTEMFQPDIDVVFLTLLTDPNLGVYREKSSGAVVAFGEYTNDLTDECLWQQLIKKELFVANCNFTENNLRYIREHFEFLGRINPAQTVRNLDRILENMNAEAKLVLLLGSETPYENNLQPAYADRHLFHKELNDRVRQWASGKKNVSLLDVNRYITGQENFTNNINHFNKAVYYSISKDLIALVNRDGVATMKESTPLEQKIVRICSMIARAPQKLKRIVRRMLHRGRAQ